MPGAFAGASRRVCIGNADLQVLVPRDLVTDRIVFAFVFAFGDVLVFGTVLGTG